mgnify:CR=1 FL=1
MALSSKSVRIPEISCENILAEPAREQLRMPGQGIRDRNSQTSRKISVAYPNEDFDVLVKEAERRQVTSAVLLREALSQWIAAGQRRVR